MRIRSCYNKKEKQIKHDKHSLFFFKMTVVCFRNFACFGWYCIDQDQECLNVYICIYISIYIYTYRYVKTIYLWCMQAAISLFSVISERPSLIKNVLLFLLLLFFPIGPLCPFITPNNLSLSLCSPPANHPLFPYSLIHSSSPFLLCPPPPSPPLPVLTSLCLHKTA